MSYLNDIVKHTHPVIFASQLYAETLNSSSISNHIKNVIGNDRNYEIHDCRLEPIQFNGAERLHGVTTISSGKRFSLVFYKNKSKPIDPY